jgi:hypothetical protein
MTIRHDNDTVLTDAQLETLRAIEHGYGNGTDPEAQIEYGYCDVDDVVTGRPGEQMVVLTRGVKWDNERVIWTMDLAGELTIH